jgi:hypothetical protein
LITQKQFWDHFNVLNMTVGWNPYLELTSVKASIIGEVRCVRLTDVVIVYILFTYY